MSETRTVQAVPNGGWDKRVRAFRYARIVDSFAVLSERYLVLVDTLISRAAMAGVMELLAIDGELRPERSLIVVNTHGDWDHVWGNGLFVGPHAQFPAPIIGHLKTVDRMESEESHERLAAAQRDDPGQYATAGWQTPTMLCTDGLRIDGGDLTLHLLPTPGHTPDHVAVWIPEAGVLLPGDAAEAPLPLVYRGGDVPLLRHSLSMLAALPATSVLYCHAPGNSSPKVIAANQRYFDELEERCRSAGSSGDYADAASALRWPLDEAIQPDLLPLGGEDLAFYRRAHNQAIAAMMEWLESTNGTT